MSRSSNKKIVYRFDKNKHADNPTKNECIIGIYLSKFSNIWSESFD